MTEAPSPQGMVIVEDQRQTRQEKKAERDRLVQERIDKYSAKLQYEKDRTPKYFVRFFVEPFKDYQDSVGASWISVIPRVGETIKIHAKFYRVTQVVHDIMFRNEEQNFDGAQRFMVHLG
jgi:hypothetical protein